MAEATKPPYQDAMDAFIEADTEYHMLESCILAGEFIPNTAIEGTLLKTQFLDLIQELRDKLEERNVRLKNVQDLLRQQVVLPAAKWRGPEAKPAKLTVGPFEVSSVTYRGFDAKSLIKLARDHGLLERLMDLQTIDKEGKQKKLVDQVYDIDFPGVFQWLKSNKLDAIINGAYDEKEGTPQVKGPKPLTFLGDKK